MSFSMRTLIGPVPLLGALLLSTAPVQAYEEFDEVCITSDVAVELCLGILCKLTEKVYKCQKNLMLNIMK